MARARGGWLSLMLACLMAAVALSGCAKEEPEPTDSPVPIPSPSAEPTEPIVPAQTTPTAEPSP